MTTDTPTHDALVEAARRATLMRTPERWAAMKPEAVVEGSQAQVLYALKDAQHDIAAQAARMREMEAENERLKRQKAIDDALMVAASERIEELRRERDAALDPRS